MKQLLYHKIIGKGAPVVILHGFLGSSDNWLTLSKILSEFYQIILVDQRNHGRSFHDEEWSYKAMAEDLKILLDNLELTHVHLIGHSMGGKTVMEFSKIYPKYCNKIIVADIAPKAYPVHHQEILNGMKSIPLETLKSRKEAEQHLEKVIPNKGTLLFILKNLGRGKDGFYWKPNLSVLDEKIEAIGQPLKTTEPFIGEVLFVKGENSDYIKEEDWEHIVQLFPNSKLAVLPNAGHWLHAEQPQKFLELILDFLSP